MTDYTNTLKPIDSNGRVFLNLGDPAAVEFVKNAKLATIEHDEHGVCFGLLSPESRDCETSVVFSR